MARRGTNTSKMCDRYIVLAGIVASILFVSPVAGGEKSATERYVLDYPVAQQFCLPVETYADDVTQTVQKVGGRTIRHQLNGGYGLPVVIMVGNQNLLHLGSDVAWHRVGAPVFAIADGVVRVSQGPAPAVTTKGGAKTITARANAGAKGVEIKSGTAGTDDAPIADPNGGETNSESKDSGPVNNTIENRAAETTKNSAEKNHGAPAAIGWGNVIAIEHHLPDGIYVTSIYGHLGNGRRVSVGDIVHAGEMIGAIGSIGVENGGFKPHLHFGIRSGRMFELGRKIFTITHEGQTDTVKLVNFDEKEIELETPSYFPLPMAINLYGHEFTISNVDDKIVMPAAALNYIQPNDFAITGYGLSTDGWLNPSEFLSQMLARYPQAPFGGVRQQAKTPNSNR
jgi:murein DD-endopeptidase MepM/ murein hydrolase activator NlpD